MLLTREQLAELFEYRDGVLYRRVAPSNNVKIGDAVGTIDGKGYLHVNIRSRFYRVHRLIFFMAHGWLPPQVDHRNRNKLDNRIENLRAATQHGNSGNSGIARHNTSGFRGVSRNSASGKWHAQIKIHGKVTYLGRRDTPEEAARLYDAAARQHFGEFATVNYATA